MNSKSDSENLNADQLFEMLQVNFPDGRWSTKLRHTADIEDAYRRWLAADCEHESEPVFRRKQIKSGNPQIVEVCQDCGFQFGSPISYSKVQNVESIPFLGELSRDRYDRQRREDWRDQKIIFWEKQDTKISAEYEAYLNSREWKAKRTKVLLRAQGICEGCREAKATQVHHLSYDHRFHEFLWELVAVCDDCHARTHPEKQGTSIGDD